MRFRRAKVRVAIFLFTILFILASGLTLAESNVVRLHVLANSDSQEDQRLKELVRDNLVSILGPELAQLNPQEVEGYILTHREEIANLAREIVMKAGSNQRITVEYGVEIYPTRLYGNSLWPSGRYRSLKVLLGEGEGNNWWCLLFPPLCFAEGVAETQEAERGIPHTLRDDAGTKTEVRVRFWLWDKLMALVSRIGGDKGE